MPAITGELREATLQAERILLGAILINSADGSMEAINYCRSRLLPDDFLDFQYRDPLNTHARIYQAMLHCHNPHQVTTAQTLNELNILRKGDIAYLSECIIECPCSLAYDEFCEAVKQYAIQRQGKVKTKGVEIL